MDFRAHGANPEKFFALFGIPVPDEIHDFSSNVNAVRWNGRTDFDENTLASYPDDEAAAVRRLIAERCSCGEDSLLVTNGSNEAIYLLASYMSGAAAAVLEPCYGEYERALLAYGAGVHHIFDFCDLTEEDKYVWLCNPCNPTGEYTEAAALAEIFAEYPDKKFIIDEAYRDFMYGGQKQLDAREFANVIVLRSLTKIYHLCGARIGYVLAAPAVIEKLKSRQPTWSVNAPAQAAALAFMKDTEFPEQTRSYYRAEMPRFIGALRELGCDICDTAVNFFIMRADDDEKLIRFLLGRGIAVRHTRNFPGLDGKFVRIAARTREENDIFIDAMKAYKAYQEHGEHNK
jgi:threonine-phosphate decarboxylase